MRKRFDPSELEPKNGDFAAFVEKLNEKSVRELKALQVNDELMREQINSELNGAASGVWTGNPGPKNQLDPVPTHRDTVIAQPEDAFKVDSPDPNPTKRTNAATRAGNISSMMLIFSAFALFAYGGMTGDEELIFTAIFIVFITIFSNIVRHKRRR